MDFLKGRQFFRFSSFFGMAVIVLSHRKNESIVRIILWIWIFQVGYAIMILKRIFIDCESIRFIFLW